MKQRITLIVLAVLFVAAGSYAQVIKDLKQPSKKELQMQQSIGKLNGFRSAVAKHAKQMGKDLTKKHQPAALRRTAADIISKQPEGTKVSYSRNGYAYVSSMFGTYSTEVSGAVGSVVFGADNKVYFKDIVSQAGTNTWVVGTISGNKITINLPQTAWDSGEGYCIDVAKMTYDATEKTYVRAEDQTVTLNYDAATGVISTPKNSELESGYELIGLSYDDDMAWAGYGDWNVTYEKVTDALVEAPAGLTTETYSLAADGYTGSLVNVGFDGNDVYVQGIDPNLPENWVKGTINGNKVTFKNGQYVGADEVAGSHQYLMSATAVEEYYPEFNYTYIDYTLSDADITFDYDAATKTLSNSSLFLLNGGKTNVNYLSTFDKAVIAPFKEVAATPAAPEVTLNENGYEYFSYGYGWGSVYVDLKTCDVNGNYTLPEKTSYKLWVKVNGEEKPLSLSAYDYIYQTDETMTEIPYDYADGWDIGNSNNQKYIYYYVIGPEAYGVQTIYRGGGEEHASEISWVNVEGIGADVQPAAATPAYPDATIGANDNRIDYGFYTGAEDINVATNNYKPETYDVAVKFDDPALVGTLIESITFPLQEVKGVSDISVFLTSQLRVENGKNAADLVVKSVTPAEPGFITVTLDKPYTIPEGGVYVGYSLTVNDLTSAANATPITVATKYNDGGYYLHTSDGVLKWLDFGQFTNVSAMVQIKIAGSSVKSNAVAIVEGESQFVKTGDAITVPVSIVNYGSKGVKSLDIQYSVAGKTDTQHITANVDGFFGKQATVELNIPAIAEKGNYELALKVSKVNDADNELTAETKVPVIALNTVPKKRTLLEEYTGTWCGWCPRGFVALEKLAELYPDEYVLASYHNGDDMEIMDSYSFPSSVSGFPGSYIDRVDNVDPYYGSSENTAFGVADDLAARNKQFGQADINLTSKLSSDNQTVDIDAEVIFPYELTDGKFAVEYILIADGLTDANWKQSNYYSGMELDDPTAIADMKAFVEGESYVTGLVFNDVVVLTSEILGGAQQAIATAAADAPVKLQYSFALANALNTAGAPVIQDVNKLKVIAVLLNTETGEVVNANVAKVGNSTGITISEMSQKSVGTYFDLQGRRVVKPAKGLYINNGRAVIVK